MEKQNQNTDPTPLQDQEPFPELSQDQIDRIVNRQLMRLDREYNDCINAKDLHQQLAEENKVNLQNQENQTDVNDEEEGDTEENGYEKYEEIESDEEENEDIQTGSGDQQQDAPTFPEGSGFKRGAKPIPKEKAEEMQKFISGINIKPPNWAQNLSDDQFKNWVGKMLQVEK